MKRLPTWAGKSSFEYEGTVKDGTVIYYGKNYRWKQKITSEQYRRLLNPNIPE